MAQYASCTFNTSRKNRTTCLHNLFLFLRDTSRGLSRIFPRNKPHAGRQVLRYTPVAAPVYATSVTLQRLRIPHLLYTNIFQILIPYIVIRTPKNRRRCNRIYIQVQIIIIIIIITCIACIKDSCCFTRYFFRNVFRPIYFTIQINFTQTCTDNREENFVLDYVFFTSSFQSVWDNII